MAKYNTLNHSMDDDGSSDETIEYYDDEFIAEESTAPTGKVLSRARRFSILFALGMVSSAIAANVTLSFATGSEFGQGVMRVKACTPTLTIAPVSGYENSGSGTFTMDAVDISGIPDSCIGYDFVIKVWDDTTQSPLKVTDTSGNDSLLLDYVRVSMLAGKDFAMVGSPNAYVDILDTSTTTDNQISLVYDPGALQGNISHYADAKNVYKVTVETFKTGS
jgi:hypothetical protein